MTNRVGRMTASLVLLCFTLAPAVARGDGFAARPDAHAPIGVMGDHVHHAGDWMLSYRYARMRMDGNRDRTDSVSRREILNPPPDTFQVAPTDMDMSMHMFGLMVAPHDRVTLMAMLPFVDKEMDHVTVMGGRFETESDGVGDLRLAGLVRLYQNEHHDLHLNAGLSVPTGSFDEKDRLPTGRGILPYPMQLGSGTVDFLPGLTYMGHADWLSWGAQGMGTVRAGENSRSYTLGNRVDLTSWAAVPITSWLSLSFRAAWQWQDNIHGEDRTLNLDPTAGPTVPTADPDRRGGHRLDLLGGLNFVVPLGPLGRHRLAIEGGVPAYEWVYGPQLETDWRIIVGWQFAGGGLPAFGSSKAGPDGGSHHGGHH